MELIQICGESILAHGQDMTTEIRFPILKIDFSLRLGFWIQNLKIIWKTNPKFQIY